MKRLAAGTLATLLFLGAMPAACPASVRPSDRVGDVAVASGPLSSVAPDVEMAAGELVTSDGRVLWSRVADDERAMASITKIMTAVVVLDHLALDDTLTVPKAAIDIGQSDAGLRQGDKLTVLEALEAMLIKSGNDAALALALRTSKNENAFVALMNAKAAALGMTHTRFANSYGLDEPHHYSSASDLAVLGRYAMTYRVFRDIVRRKSAVIGLGSRKHRIETSDQLLGTYRGANGIKTGWTGDAGYCVVASAKRDGVELVAVVLGTTSANARFVQAARLLDWGFEHLRQKAIRGQGNVIGTSRVSDYDDVSVRVLAARTATATVFDVSGEVKVSARYDSSMRAPVTSGEVVGVLFVSQGDTLLASTPLVAADSVAAPGFFERLRIGLGRLWRSIFG
jgi:D-alanyl-D-alanine carboxypeptidase (penicillin-binding protein 5/6)